MKHGFKFLLSVLVLLGFACNLPGSVTDPAEPSVVSDVPSLVPPTPLLSEIISILSEPFTETGDKPIYTITAQIPVAQGADALRLAGFNAVLRKTADDQIIPFRDAVLTIAPIDPISAGSSFDMQYSVVGQALDYWSIKYEIDSYFDGAAHPAHYSATVNYDLDRDRPFTLDELFTPGSNYLQVIADYCKADLAKRDIGFDGFASGADPLPENYTRWNISKEGLVITFDEYQVAPYAAGPQVVVIPLSALASVTDTNTSILAIFAK